MARAVVPLRNDISHAIASGAPGDMQAQAAPLEEEYLHVEDVDLSDEEAEEDEEINGEEAEMRDAEEVLAAEARD